jgi:DNA-binding XRE family transcriptional regulator
MNTFNFGENLREIRTAKGISQQAMAVALRISQTKYSRIERTKAIPKVPPPISIAKALGVPLADLMPPVEEGIVLATITSDGNTIKLQPKPFLQTTIGRFAIIAAAMVMIDGVYQATHGICEALKTTDQTLITAKYIASLATLALCIVFFITKQRK